MTCYIFGAAACAVHTLSVGVQDMVIAADGGLVHTQALGLSADIVIGDFDSLGRVPTGDEVVRLPVEKDMTDIAAAIEAGRARGYHRFVLLGATGGRPDHTMANYQLLADLAARGEAGYLVDTDFSVAAISDGSALTFDSGFTGTFSVFAVGGEAHGVSIAGAQYLLSDHTLTPTCPLGVSNAFTGAEATVFVQEGTLLVMWEGQELPKNTKFFP